ncbi:hypothetical protein CDL15_Pgr004574 [Punica granatum]|uniref:CMP/dCMP-type deaminase domain-containing protein n=1 Tax=Punica granatum TaxID=22663 RepID=A0A218WPL6_PUNGR|nr:hypothetical protein CDL15_Pgr004574 [Punica granatum]
MALSFCYPPPITCRLTAATIRSSHGNGNYTLEASLVRRAADLSDKSSGFTSPHPNFGCVIANPGGNVVGEGYLYAQGTTPAEVQAVEAAGADLCMGATAYLNMEPGDCHGDSTAVSALVQAGIARVVVGMRHPLQHLRGNAVRALRSQGIQVDVPGEDLQSKAVEEAQKSCCLVNVHLIYGAASRVPFSVLNYAMTLDDPRLTARHGGGHLPVRIVMTQTLDLPEEANLWDISEVSTIVVTQRGARRSFQKYLASKGVEVVEFGMLNPRDVMEYFYDRGYLSILWECGGTLAASAISLGVIHKVFAFVAPKIIGGRNAPSPVGELGMVEMSQALDLSDVSYEQPIPDLTPAIPSMNETSAIDPTVTPYEPNIIFFYKTWDPYGAFSNFSPHPIRMPNETGDYVSWSSVEHYYQVRPDWDSMKIDVMYRALKCKFSIYPHLNSMLLSTAGSILVEASLHDLFWGGGREGEGLNYLGRLLMQLRSEFLGEYSSSIHGVSLEYEENISHVVMLEVCCNVKNVGMEHKG